MSSSKKGKNTQSNDDEKCDIMMLNTVEGKMPIYVCHKEKNKRED